VAKKTVTEGRTAKAAVPKTDRKIREAYGLALELGGLMNAQDVLTELLDEDDKEKFSNYFPRLKAFQAFAELFGYARFDVIAAYGWKDSIDKDKLQTDPSHEQTIKNYFQETFKPAMGTSVVEG